MSSPLAGPPKPKLELLEIFEVENGYVVREAWDNAVKTGGVPACAWVAADAEDLGKLVEQLALKARGETK